MPLKVPGTEADISIFINKDGINTPTKADNSIFINKNGINTPTKADNSTYIYKLLMQLSDWSLLAPMVRVCNADSF